jgi:TonB family protein
MKSTVAFLILLFAATAQAASTPSVQNVRFAQEIGPTDLVTPPHVLTHPAALYTDESRRRGIQGNVVVQVYFDEDGTITVLKVAKGLGYGLDENALQALKDWRFAPALRDGLPVSAVAEVEILFRLNDVYSTKEDLMRRLKEIERIRPDLERAIRAIEEANRNGKQ